MKNNILIVVSGTGGHVYPGFALGEELKKHNYNPVYIVNNNKNGISLKIVQNSGYDYEILDFKAPSRKFGKEMLLFPFKFVKALFDTRKILQDIVRQTGLTGGYEKDLMLNALCYSFADKFPSFVHFLRDRGALYNVAF